MTKYTSDGPDMVSTESRVGKWTTRQAIDVNEAKQANANDAFYGDYRLAA